MFSVTLGAGTGVNHKLSLLYWTQVPLTLHPLFSFAQDHAHSHRKPGADFHLRDKKGKTALSYAVQQQQPAAEALLRQRGSEQCVAAASLFIAGQMHLPAAASM
jgi:hypothetical protein